MQDVCHPAQVAIIRYFFYFPLDQVYCFMDARKYSTLFYKDHNPVVKT